MRANARTRKSQNESRWDCSLHTFNATLVEQDLLLKSIQVKPSTGEAVDISIEPIKVVLTSQEMRIASGTRSAKHFMNDLSGQTRNLDLAEKTSLYAFFCKDNNHIATRSQVVCFAVCK
jgi:hypothetical protein